MSEISKGALTSENNNSFPNNNTGYITPTILRTFNQNMIDSLVDEISYTADSASVNTKITNLQSWSSSLDATYATDAQLSASVAALSASIAVTDLAQSQSISQLLGFSSSLDATFATDAQLTALSTSVAVTDSGQDSKINSLTSATGSYITSAETASMNVLSSSYAVTASFALNAGASVDTGSLLTTSSFNSYTQSASTNVSGAINTATGSSLVTASFSSQTLTFTKGDGSQFSLAIPDVSGSVPAGTVSSSAQIAEFGYATTGSNTFTGQQTIQNILELQQPGNQLIYTSILQDALDGKLRIGQSGGTGFVLNGGDVDVSGFNITASNFIGTASYSNEAISASFAQTASFALNAGASIDTGSFATTGSNTFVGNQIVSSSIIGVGDLYIQPTNQSTNFSNISASVSGNIIFGAIFGDSQPQQTGSFVVSGSNNVVLVGKPTATSGYYSYVNGALNVVGAAVRLSTSSLLRPTMYNNIIQRAVTLNFTTSSFAAAPNFGNNLLYGQGTTNINHQSGSINFASNLIGGGNIFTSTQNVTPSTQRPGITSNIFNGTQNFLHQSSSITLDRNIMNGLTAPGVRNDFSNSFNDGLTVSRNIVNGNGVFIYNSGSTTGGGGVGNRSITDNLFGGVNIIVSSSHIAANNNNANLVGAIVHGYNLNVSASSTTSTGGNVFVGRNNDTSSNLASTSDIIFAVGTGTSTSARKTGLWIDTASLTTINGGLYVTQSQVTLTNSGSTPGTLALAIRSGSVEISSPEGSGYFSSTLPFTASAGRFNRDAFVGDLRISSGFGGNGTLNVGASSYFTGSVDVSGSVLTLQNSNAVALAIRSGSFELTTPQGSGSFYSNLPITSSNLRINGDGIISDLFVSGVFAGNSTLNVAGNSYFTGSVNVNNSTNITGSLYIQSGSGDLYVHGHKQFNVGAFSSLETQSGSANVSQSINFGTTDYSSGVSISNNSRINITNAGVYSLTFSLQLLADTGADTIYVWLKKNGTNVSNSSTKQDLANNEEAVLTVNFVVDAAANDYYEIVWQSSNGDAVLLYEGASGNIPATPSVIATVTQAR